MYLEEKSSDSYNTTDTRNKSSLRNSYFARCSLPIAVFTIKDLIDFPLYSILNDVSYGGKYVCLLDTISKLNTQMMIMAKFGYNWLSSLAGEMFSKSYLTKDSKLWK